MDHGGSKTIFDNVLECLEHNISLTCIANSAARTIEHSTNETLSLSQAIVLRRNQEPIPTRQAKSLDGFQRLLSAFSTFIDTHSFSIDLTQGRSIGEKASKDGGGGGGGGGGLFNMNTKAMKKEKKYYQYAFMVLLGIFGLTGPLVMKILGIMAAQALLASKAALIIVGGVALKKIFNDGGSKSKVKVTTLPVYDKYESEEENDRISYAFNQIPYGYGPHGYDGSSNPYSGFSNHERSEPAAVFYGRRKQNTANS
ncbi:hypothetical protein JTB14_026688 [Gonioctena quinquepunctata]|nr:hypothetical protein JTB14_026688 [Gonioctena quinquepunctata]